MKTQRARRFKETGNLEKKDNPARKRIENKKTKRKSSEKLTEVENTQ